MSVSVRRRGALVASAAVLVGVFSCLPACSVQETEVDVGPSCTNGVRDEGEVGTDCGGVCTAKCTGSGCTANEECTSLKCENGACGAPAGKPCGVGAPVPTCDDGQACELDKDCKSAFCEALKCVQPPADSHTDGKHNAGETDVDCGGSVKTTKPCVDGQKCIDSADCVGTCTAGICGPIGPADGKKNNDETDVDCGGATAPKCVDGKTCAADGDCATGYCPTDTKKCTAPRYDDNVKNGNETDVDCGGTGPGVKKCPETKECLVDGDCLGACKYTKKCVDVPSCKPRFGGDTCGTFEPGDGFETHESCCKTLPVPGYTDPNQPGKTVYLDKYEITAGRMRAFIDAISAANGGAPKIREYTAAHRPAAPYRWNNGWEAALPNGLTSASASAFTVTNPTGTNFLYPGQDEYDNPVNRRTQTTWGVASGSFNIDVNLVRAMTSAHFFPEYTTGPTWPAPDYAASHGLNCSNTDGSYGYGTYWFDTPTMVANTGDATLGKYFSKDQMDQKALNCAPFALFAAFCAWDGGQLMTAEVFDHVAGGPWPAASATAAEPPRLTGGRSLCNGGTLNTFSDGGQNCAAVYYFPNDMGHDRHDGSSRIAPPGRVPADVVRINAADEPWMDLKGNLLEAVMRSDTTRFDFRGYGAGYGTAIHHRLQQTTPRMKGASYGARCMRFK